MNKKLCIFMSVLAASAFTFALKAEAKECCCLPHTPSTKPHFYLDIGVGHAFDSSVGSGNFIIVLPDDVAIYSLTGNNTSPNNLLIGAGFLWSQPYQANSPYFPFLSLGLQYQYTNFDNKKTLMGINVSAAGEEAPLNDHSHYVFSENSLFANLKLDLYRWGRVMPYLNLGLGASWNEANEKDPFIDTGPLQADALRAPTARSTAFSYNVGAGLDFLVTERFWLSLGYNYNNFGHVQIDKLSDTTNPASNDFINAHPFSLRNLTTQNVQLTGRYVFG